MSRELGVEAGDVDVVASIGRCHVFNGALMFYTHHAVQTRPGVLGSHPIDLIRHPDSSHFEPSEIFLNRFMASVIHLRPAPIASSNIR